MEGISEKDILTKKQDLNVLHNKIAADKENLASIQNRNKQLLFQIELMKQMQHTADEERGKLAAQKNLFVATDKKLAQLKLRRFQSVENVSTMKHKASLEKQDMGPIHEYLKGDDIVTRQAQDLTAQAPAIEEDEHSREEQLEVARELVKKNRQIFELEQVGYHSNMHHAQNTVLHKNTVRSYTLSTCTCRGKSFNDAYFSYEMAPAM